MSDSLWYWLEPEASHCVALILYSTWWIVLLMVHILGVGGNEFVPKSNFFSSYNYTWSLSQSISKCRKSSIEYVILQIIGQWLLICQFLKEYHFKNSCMICMRVCVHMHACEWLWFIHAGVVVHLPLWACQDRRSGDWFFPSTVRSRDQSQAIRFAQLLSAGSFCQLCSFSVSIK